MENRESKLFIDGVSSLVLAEKYDTPLYVISEDRIRDNYRRLLQALSKNYDRIKIFFAAKANSNLAVLKILEQEGANIDAVSPGEVFLALKSGFTPDRVLFTGTSVRNDELKFLLDSGVNINVDSASQLGRLIKIGVPKMLSFRVNPEVGAGHHSHCITAGKESKFGIWEEDILRTYDTAKRAGVEKFGIHMHIGSGVLDPEPFLAALDKLLAVAKRVHDKADICFEFVDMGGGIGIPYKPDEEDMDLDAFSDRLLTLFKNRISEYGLGEPYFCVEPGRYIVADACVLLTRVNTIKVTPYKRFVGVDAGFNTLMRPAMYGSYHHIVVANKMSAMSESIYDVAGPICESGDLLAKNRTLPVIVEGDLLAILDSGAYGFSMSSQYNSRPRPAEVMVNKGKHKLVREREELDDLLSRQQPSAKWQQ